MEMEQNERIQDIFNWLVAVATPIENLRYANLAFVFGRADRRLADTAGKLFHRNLIDHVVISGGIGKDSGALIGLELDESKYIAALLHWNHGIPVEKITIERDALNGADNSRLGMKVILKKGLPHRDVIIVAHATSLRRLFAVHQLIDKELAFGADYQLVATDYPFDSNNPADQKEAIA